MPRITVEGRATLSQPAERGTVHLTVSFAGARRTDVVAAAERAHVTVVAQAKQHTNGGAATWWAADGVTARVYDEWQKPSAHEDGVMVRRFRATSGLRVKFVDFAALAGWTLEVAQLDGVTVGGVTWALTEKRRDALLIQARTQAAQDAVVRAQAYADALGLGPVTLSALYEDGLRPHLGAAAGGEAGVAVRGAAPAAGGGGGGLELKPEDIDVVVTLSADFEA